MILDIISFIIFIFLTNVIVSNVGGNVCLFVFFFLNKIVPLHCELDLFSSSLSTASSFS